MEGVARKWCGLGRRYEGFETKCPEAFVNCVLKTMAELFASKAQRMDQCFKSAWNQMRCCLEAAAT